MKKIGISTVWQLITSKMIKFYCRYVDATLLLVKSADMPHIHNLFNKSEFDKTVLKMKCHILLI